MKKTILLADDSPTIRKVVELTFNDSEYRVEAVASGAEALESLDRLRPELVLADVAMPGPDGYEVCRRIKKLSHPVPVMLLAGAFESFDEDKARSCGSNGHLKKPFESRVLVARVRQLLEGPEAVCSPPEADRPADPGTARARGPVAPRTVLEVSPVVTGRPSPQIASLSPEDLEALTDAVLERLSSDRIHALVDELVPRLAERIVRERIEELERGDG